MAAEQDQSRLSAAMTSNTRKKRDHLKTTWSGTTGDRTRVVEYLKSRGLSGNVLEAVSDQVVRFHPSLDYWDYDEQDKLVKLGTFPAMVAKVTDGEGAGVTLHRTYLDPDDPGKLELGDSLPAKKLMSPATDGGTRGASIKIFPAGSVLGLTEGIETALAVHTATGQSVWSCVSAQGLETVDIPTEVRAVHVWADNDASEVGQRKAAALAERLTRSGHKVYLHIPPEPGADWLDIFTRSGEDALLDELTRAQEIRRIDLATALEDLAEYVKRYVFLSLPEQLTAVVLWAAHTWVVEQFETTPYLAVLSPEKRSGKTRLLDVLELVVARPWRAVTPSEAVLYRKIEADRPSLLLDEIDTIFGPKTSGTYEGVRAILNAGFRRGTKVPRCVGEGKNMAVQDFDVYGAKAFAGIGRLPDTVGDRSIIIDMLRRAPDEPVERFRYREASAEAEPLRTALERWSQDANLAGARPDLPAELDDRAADSWEALLAIAEVAGDDWPDNARRAARVLSAGRMEETASSGIKLLIDCRRIFHAEGQDRLTSERLVEALTDLEESPWSDMTPRRLAAKLKHYRIAPGTIRVGDRTPKGYRKTDFTDAWRRYLPTPSSPETASYPQHRNISAKLPANTGFLPSSIRATEAQHEAPQMPSVAEAKSADLQVKDADVADVADKGRSGRLEERDGYFVEVMTI